MPPSLPSSLPPSPLLGPSLPCARRELTPWSVPAPSIVPLPLLATIPYFPKHFSNAPTKEALCNAGSHSCTLKHSNRARSTIHDHDRLLLALRSRSTITILLQMHSRSRSTITILNSKLRSTIEICEMTIHDHDRFKTLVNIPNCS